MTTPIEIWHDMLIFTVLCTGYFIFGNDKINYTDTIAGVIATLGYIISAFVVLGGVQPETGGAWSSVWLFFVILAIGIYVGMMSILAVIDIRNDRGAHIGDMSLDGLP